jgi:hypothetical protein
MFTNNGHSIISESKIEQRLNKLIAINHQDLIQSNQDKDLIYLSANSKQIVNKITITKEWSAVRVLSAFIRSAIKSQAHSNPLTEIMFTEAFERATAIDKQFAIDGQPLGIRKLSFPSPLKNH